MKKRWEAIIRLFLSLFMAALLGLAPRGPTWAFDAHDGGFDGGWDNDHDAGEDTASDDAGDGHAGHDGAEGYPQHGQHGEHGQEEPHHEHRHTDRDNDARHHERGHEKGHHHTHPRYAGVPAWGFAPGFGAFGFGGLGLGGFGGPGPGWFGYSPSYYPPGYYDYRPTYYPPLIFQPASPPLYIQKQDTAGTGTGAASTGAQPGYWHYCREPEGYYPQVQECPDGWEAVAPQAPDDNRK